MKRETYETERYIGTAMLFLLKQFTGISEAEADLGKLDIYNFFIGDELLGLPFRKELRPRIDEYTVPQNAADVLRLFWEMIAIHADGKEMIKPEGASAEKWAMRANQAGLTFLRLSWFKTFYPKEFYAAALSSRRNGYLDFEELAAPRWKIEQQIAEGEDRESRYGFSEENGDMWIKDAMEIWNLALECRSAGIPILPVDINKSDPAVFSVEENGIRIPFDLYGDIGRLSEDQILARRAENPFKSKKELKSFLKDYEWKFLEDHHMLDSLAEGKPSVFRCMEELIRKMDRNCIVDYSEKAEAESTEGMICSGYEILDDLIGGFVQGELYYIGGRPAMGTTAFLLNLAVSIAMKQRKPVWYCSLDSSQEQLVYRAYAIADKGKISFVQSSFQYELHRTSAEAFNEDFRRIPLYISNEYRHLCDIEQLIRNEAKGGIVMIDCVDDIQISDVPGLYNRNVEKSRQFLEELNRRLKQLAVEVNVPIIAAAQIRRSVENRADKHPTEKDFMCILDDDKYVDGILTIYRENCYDPVEKNGKAELEMWGFTNKRKEKIELLYDEDSGRFYE